MKIYWNPRTFTATSPQGNPFVGYEASNVENSAINIEFWTQDSTQTQVQLDLGAAVQIDCIFFHAVNISETGLSIELDANTINTGIVGQTDNYDRSWIVYKPVEEGYTGNYQFVRLNIPAGTPRLDAYPGYRIGAAYVMQNFTGLGHNPAWGFELEHIVPSESDVLPNGALPITVLGPEYDVVTMTWNAIRENLQYPEYFIRRALRFGPIIADMSEYYDWLIWPATTNDTDTRTTLRSPQLDEIRMDLRELVTI